MEGDARSVTIEARRLQLELALDDLIVGQRCVDQSEDHAVDRVPHKDRKDHLEPEVVAEESGVILRGEDERNHDRRADDCEQHAEGESLGQVSEQRVAPWQEYMRAESEQQRKENAIPVVRNRT